MLSIILFLLLAWLFFKLGIGIIKITLYLIAFGIIAIFFSYLLLPIFAIMATTGILFAALR